MLVLSSCPNMSNVCILPSPLVVSDIKVVWKILNALVPQFAHKYLQSEQSEHHQTEDRQSHYFGQLFE